MPMPPVLIASDVHLGAAPPEQERAFHRWLDSTAPGASRLVINGDLFDFWFEYRGGRIPPGHEPVLERLRSLVDAGVPITLMGGNHDWWGGRYLREEVGVEFLQAPVVRRWSGYRTFLAHGDGLGKGDLGYRALKLVLRGRLTRWSFAQLGPRLGGTVARWVSQTEHRWGEPDAGDVARSKALEAWGVAKLAAEPGLDLVVLGHTHIPRLREVGDGRWYVNSGDWVRNRNYVVLREGAPPELRDFRD